MLRRIGGRVWMTALTFAVAGGLYLGAPPERVRAAGDCGAFSGPLCKMQQDCAWFIFYKSCTTKYYYYRGPEEMI